MTAASRFLVKQFDSISGTVHEDIDISVARITSKYIGHDAAEGVITFSHSGGPVVQHIIRLMYN